MNPQDAEKLGLGLVLGATHGREHRGDSATRRGSSDENDPFLGGRHTYESSKGRRTLTRCGWCLIFINVWIASLIATWRLSSGSAKPRYSFEHGYDTELDPLKASIHVKEVKFTGDLDWADNGTLVLTGNEGPTRYVGPPSPEIDAAWAQLLLADGVDLKGEEAKSVVGTTIQKKDGWWLVGVDVFHQIHCLNMIRRAMHPEYYPKNDADSAYNAHVEHCVDYLRQVLMCKADITRIPVEWSTKYSRPKPRFDTWHTCRDFGKIQDWVIERSGLEHPF